jgi:hypothetical protein
VSDRRSRLARNAGDVMDDALVRLAQLLPTGRDAAVPASELAALMGVSERTVGSMVADLIDQGWIVGSVCSGERPGYFHCRDEEDLEIGTAHIRARAAASFARIRTLRASAQKVFGDRAATLFDLEEFAR